MAENAPSIRRGLERRKTARPSYDLHTVVRRPHKSFTPRALLPLHEPPPYLMLYPPALPAEAKERVRSGDLFSEDYALSTHLLPAAYPRTTPAITVPADLAHPLPSDSSKAQRAERSKRLLDFVMETKNSQMRGGFPPDVREQRLLWNSVNRYRRRKPAGRGRKSVTLVLFHANGFPKEVSSSLEVLLRVFGC